MIRDYRHFWLVVAIYITFLFFIAFGFIAQNTENVIHNRKMIQELMERKEYHIKVSEDNNKKLQEIVDLLKEE